MKRPRTQLPGTAGTVTSFTTDGSSLSFIWSVVLSPQGTLSVESANPSGTGTGFLNCGSDAIESMRYRLDPLTVHSLSGPSE